MASMPATRRFRYSTSNFFRSKLFERVSRVALVPDWDRIDSFSASADVANRFWLDRLSLGVDHFHCRGGGDGDEGNGAAHSTLFRLSPGAHFQCHAECRFPRLLAS